MLDKDCTYFNHMSNPYYITPKIDHYICMVDLLSCASYVEETLNFIVKILVKHVVVVWMCFLGAYISHMNIGIGVFTKKMWTYVLSNIYAKVGRWCKVQMVRRLMKDKAIKKIFGCS